MGAICVLFLLVTQASAADTALRSSQSGSLASCCGDGDCSTVAIAADSEREFHAEGIATFFSKLVDTRDFPARWYCGTWSLDVGWLHIVSDVAIFGAYFAIPLVLMGFFASSPRFALSSSDLVICPRLFCRVESHTLSKPDCFGGRCIGYQD
ncbi:sensory box sensor histidine kinase/response regulator [Rhodopirellula maiorica SM1]|uniref:Sensory box sensor histidine kinase/response regulator n=1 Tax=Rhodopirellula maiorica SM1 TaxID=1265738 RepID=M5RMP5_9BACT|nr:hypothetical protein [Rhodopirellula maiorica]EMI20598.1 sensory box sensor histidine kinase/response regulator [Rhodopirellula maiorica SM1]